MSKVNNKRENSRIVTFEDDYRIKNGSKEGRVVYAKGSTHAIHVDNVEKLKAKKVKMKVEKVPEPKKAK